MSAKLAHREQAVGLVLVVLGALFLLAQVFDFNLGRVGWPFFVIIPGALLLAGAMLGGRSAGGLAVPGTIVTTIGVILLVQNLTGRFETWAYVWALIPTAVGVGLYLNGTLSDSERLRREGSRTAAIGLALFVAFGALFELFIFRGLAGTLLGSLLIPALLIGAGVYLLLRQWRPTGETTVQDGAPETDRQPEP